MDGAISYNKAISRTHCKIVYQNDRYEIIDLGSANGSYLNKKKLTPYQKYQIRSGDIVRLANSDFLIKI